LVVLYDRKWVDGDFLIDLGFSVTGQKEPEYWIIKKGTRCVIERHNTDSTWEVLKKKGFNRIWDCGSTEYTWNKK
jgi:hypothetical protein